MTDMIIILVVAVILTLAGGYIYRAKKRGAKCIGCPDSNSCSGTCGACGAHCDCQKRP